MKKLCAICKKEFIPKSNRQRYCPSCSKKRRHAKLLEYSRKSKMLRKPLAKSPTRRKKAHIANPNVAKPEDWDIEYYIRLFLPRDEWKMMRMAIREARGKGLKIDSLWIERFIKNYQNNKKARVYNPKEEPLDYDFNQT